MTTLHLAPEPDYFFNEVSRVHSFRARLQRITGDERRRMARRLGPDAARSWTIAARSAQLPPLSLAKNWCWLFLGGRGTGKSKSMSGAVHMAVRAGVRRLHVIGPTTADLHDILLDGPAGILQTVGSDPVPRWVQTRRRLEWPNGAHAVFFSGEEPDSLRGPQCELCIVDEIARMRYQQAVFDQLFLGLRLGARPRVLIATTPRPTPFMKRLVKMTGVSITSGSTYDNAAHLSPEFLRKIREMYEGTRIGRQELHGAMLLDPQNALFKDDWIGRAPVDEKLIEQATVGVDPSGGGDEIGIVVAAVLTDGRLAVLADRTLSASPAKWGEEVVRAHDEFNCDDVVVERNFGGDMAIDVVRQAADRAMQAGRRADNLISVKEVVASRGKAMRAEPISLLYEKGRVQHAPGLDQLEGEMLSFSREWDRTVDGSPNRLDACIWALTRLAKVQMEIPMA